MGDTKYVRTSGEGERPAYFKTTGIKEDIKQMVKDVVRMAAPRPLRERAEDVDEQVRRRSGQTTDSNNRY